MGDLQIANREEEVQYGWYAVGTLLVAWVFAYLDRQSIILLIPSIKHALLLSDASVSLVQGFAFALFFALAGLPIGRLVDRVSRRNVMAGGIALWSVMTMACGLATNFSELFAARVGVGIGEACLAPASFSMIADYFRGSRRGRAMGIVAAGAPIGSSASYFLGGAILKSLNGRDTPLPLIGLVEPWQMVFLLTGAPGLLVALLLLTVHEPRRCERAVERGVEIATFLQLLIANRAVYLPLYGALTFNFVAAYGIVAWGPVVLMRINAVPPATVGLIMGAILLITGSVAAVGGGFLGDSLARRRPQNGRLRVIWITYPLTAVLVCAFGLSRDVRETVTLIASISFLNGMFTASSYAMLTDLVPNEMRGRAVALYMLVANIAGLGLTPLAIALVTDYGFKDEMMLRQSIVFVCLPAAIATILLTMTAMRPYARVRESQRIQ